MKVQFTASESVEIEVNEEVIPIQHYLRQPGRLVKAIADESLMEQLTENRFRLKMRPLNFMEIYYFQPTVVLNVWATSGGTVYLNSEECEIKGVDYINDRFSLLVKGKLEPVRKEEKIYLVGRANLEVNVDLPPPLLFTPAGLLQVAGNSLLKGVLARIKQKLMIQLLKDYQLWSQTSEIEVKSVNVFGEQIP
ncbi:MAG: hypothetical protein N5P05_003684 [Chroococcopsis gigantea SAG 12.99]|jgi:hypothetical protein|nr:DUF1997 domain-containing protein [Chlorogloea purpurea SAG 13.99]MDV3002078.1 hypothetical protein [Chroococcopsis gigantea SAG 12.99]